jgi:hypothetical protein
MFDATRSRGVKARADHADARSENIRRELSCEECLPPRCGCPGSVHELGNKLGTITPNTGKNGGVGPTRKQDESTR